MPSIFLKFGKGCLNAHSTIDRTREERLLFTFYLHNAVRGQGNVVNILEERLLVSLRENSALQWRAEFSRKLTSKNIVPQTKTTISC